MALDLHARWHGCRSVAERVEQWLLAFAYGAALLMFFKMVKIGMQQGPQR